MMGLETREPMTRQINAYNFDVLVIGAGHAGLEAGLAAARIGLRTALLTINCDSVGQMSCNPAIGGVAKGQIVREVDALGGAMGLLTDAAAILVEGARVAGLRCRGGAEYRARAVVMTTGTFLQALMHTGEVKTVGGRAGDQSAEGLSGNLRSLGFELRRFKTGTPPRLN